MSVSALSPSAPPMREGSREGLQSELLQASLPRNQRSPGMYMIWLNTLLAAFLTVGVIGARNPELFVYSATPAEEPLIISDSKPEKKEKEPEKLRQRETDQQETAEEAIEAPPVVVPVKVLDISQVTFARPVEGITTLDIANIGSFDRAKPNIGIVGTEAKPGNPELLNKPVEMVKSGGGGGKRRLSGGDFDQGLPVPNPNVRDHGNVTILPGTKIWVTFDAKGSVMDVRLDPDLESASYSKLVRAHVRKHWKSKVGAASGWTYFSGN